MELTNNAVIPQSYDTMWIAATVVMFALLAAALVSIGRRASQLSSLLTLVWVLVAIFLPFVGPIAWFVAGAPSAKRHTASRQSKRESHA